MKKYECLKCGWTGDFLEHNEIVRCPRCGGHHIVHWGFIKKEARNEKAE